MFCKDVQSESMGFLKLVVTVDLCELHSLACFADVSLNQHYIQLDKMWFSSSAPSDSALKYEYRMFGGRNSSENLCTDKFT